MSQGSEKNLELDGASTIETLLTKVNEKTLTTTEHLEACDELLFRRMEQVEMEDGKEAARVLAPYYMECNTLLNEMLALLRTKNKALKKVDAEQKETEKKQRKSKMES